MTAITQKFAGFVNQIAVDLGLMSREQSVEILSIQARFLALAEKEIKPTERFIDADPLFEKVRRSWQNLAMENQISETDFLHHYARASSGKGFTKEEAPATGDIANALKFVSKDTKNAILTAQAAVRAEQALADIDNPTSQPKTAEDISRQHGRIDIERKFDPETLVLAQLNNKAADVLHARHKSGQQANEAEIAAIRAGTKAAYEAAAEMFGKLQVPGAGLIAQELGRVALALEKQK